VDVVHVVSKLGHIAQLLAANATSRFSKMQRKMRFQIHERVENFETDRARGPAKVQIKMSNARALIFIFAIARAAIKFAVLLYHS
jgi:hypothetical protein